MEYAAGTSRTTADGMHLLEQFSERQECEGKRRHGLCSHLGLHWDLVLESVFPLKTVKVMTVTSLSAV